jgi:hypothetical protein
MTDRDPDQVEKIAFALSRLASSLPEACRSDHPLMSGTVDQIGWDGLHAIANAVAAQAQATTLLAEQVKRIADHMTQPPPPQPKTMVGHRLPENEP